MKLRLVWYTKAWEDYLGLQREDRRTLKRINELIRELQRTGDTREGMGKPEMRKGDKSGLRAKRIDDVNRLVYRIRGEDLEIIQCKGHYED